MNPHTQAIVDAITAAQDAAAAQHVEVVFLLQTLVVLGGLCSGALVFTVALYGWRSGKWG